MIDKNMIRICDTSDVADDRGCKVEIEGFGVVAIFRFEGSYFVIDDQCTHGLGSLSDGKIAGDQVICPFHRGAFNFITGEPTKAPCTIALKTYQAEVVGTTICIVKPEAVD